MESGGMRLVFGLMVLMETAACVDLFCSFNESESCDAALGHKLSLQMVLDVQHLELSLYKGSDGSGVVVFRVKDKKERKHESIRDRSEFFPLNGSLIINSVNEADSGIYRLQIYNSEGKMTFEGHLHIHIIKAPPVALIALGCLAVILIILLVFVIHFIYRKKRRIKPASHAGQKRTEEEVQYGELAFSGSGRQRPRDTHDDCVYAEVQTRQHEPTHTNTLR